MSRRHLAWAVAALVHLVLVVFGAASISLPSALKRVGSFRVRVTTPRVSRVVSPPMKAMRVRPRATK